MTRTGRRGSAARRALRHRGFRLLALALLGSNLGTWAYQVAIVAYIYAATHSTAWVAAGALARMVPNMLLAPVGGALADRFNRRVLMVGSDAVRCLLMVLLAALVAGRGPLPLVLVVVAAAVAAGSVYVPSTAAELPSLLGEDDLAAGNATNALLYNVTMFAGPALGGLLLLTTSAASAILVNAVTFAVSAVLVWRALVGRTYAESRDLRESESLLQTTAGGARVLFGDAARRGVAVATLANYVMYGTLTVLLVALAEQRLHAGGHGFGLLIAAFGAGGIFAALVAERVAASPRAATAVFAALVLSAAPMCLLGAATTLGFALAMVFGVGLGLCVVDITGITLLQRLTPSTALGRAFGLFDALNYAMTLLGVLLAPTLADALGVSGTIVAVAIATPLACVWVVPVLRTADRASAARAALLTDRVRVLAATDLFGSCGTAALERLASQASLLPAAASQVVIRQGEPADDLYVVLDGTLAVTDEDGGGRRLRTLTPGDAFGEIGVVTGGTRTATVTATSTTELLRIPGEVFMECVQSAAPLAQTVGGVVAARLAHSRRKVAAPPVVVGSTP